MSASRTDMGKDLGKAMLAEIQENRRRLRECQRHRFERMPVPRLPMERLTCAACGGKEQAGLVFSYVRGYIAAGGNPADVAPWWAEAHAPKAAP